MGREKLEKKAPGVFGRYYASGTRALQLQFTFRGVRCRETMPGLDPDVRNHVKNAVNILGSIRRDIDRGTFNYIEYFPESRRARRFGHAVSTRTVKDIAESWLIDVERSMPHSTYRSYKGPCECWIYPAIGDKRIRDVSVEDIRVMFRDSGFSLKTARNYSIPLRAIFDRALVDDDIERSPMDRIKVKPLIAQERHVSDYDVDPLSEAEIFRFLSACRKHRPRWLEYWVVAFYTGLRTSEMYGLRWSDVDLKNRSIRVQYAVVEGKGKVPKTERSIRSVYLVDVALDALKEQRAATELVAGQSGAVFRNPTTGLTLTRYEVSQRCFDYCLKQAGLSRRQQRQTRHTYASNLLSAGEPIGFVSKQMGHKDIYITLKVYARWVSDKPGTRSDYGRRGGFARNGDTGPD